jgi:xylose dehydrogenase (NAD/NADP)
MARSAVGLGSHRHRPLRWGLLSTADINDVILRSARSAPCVEIIAVASREARRAEAYAKARAIPRAYGSYEELLADAEVDAVYVSLPNALHIEWSMAALEAGKHVFCEKPLSRDPGQVARAYAAARRRGLVFAEAFMYRHHPQTERLREIVASGELGELRTIISSHSFPMPVAEYARRLPPELDAGSLMDLGCYQLGIASLLAGPPLEVSGAQVLHEGSVDMRFAAVLTHPGGVLSHFDCAMDEPLRNHLEVVGTEASLRLFDPWHCRVSSFELLGPEGARQVPFDPGDPYRLEFEAFAAAVSGERIEAFGEAEALAQARGLRALYESARRGTAVSVSGGAPSSSIS